MRKSSLIQMKLMKKKGMCVAACMNSHISRLDDLTLADNQFDGPQFLGKTQVKDIATLLPSSNMSTHMSKMYIDQAKAPIDNIPASDRLDDPTNLDLLARFIYQVHEYLSGGLHYSSYQEKWIPKQLVPNSTVAE